jgi:putative ABC transport system permease protein
VQCGMVAGLLLIRAVTALLYGVDVNDPTISGGAAALLIWLTLGASYIPARRATRIDPTVALRYESDLLCTRVSDA